jgi:hypothetical protein
VQRAKRGVFEANLDVVPAFEIRARRRSGAHLRTPVHRASIQAAVLRPAAGESRRHRYRAIQRHLSGFNTALSRTLPSLRTSTVPSVTATRTPSFGYATNFESRTQVDSPRSSCIHHERLRGIVLHLEERLPLKENFTSGVAKTSGKTECTGGAEHSTSDPSVEVRSSAVPR